MQVAEAEAATARFVAQLDQPSAGDSAAEYAQLDAGRQRGHNQQQRQQQQALDRENLPKEQQPAASLAPQIQAESEHAARGKQASKRRKTGDAEPDAAAEQQAGRQVLKSIVGQQSVGGQAGTPDPHSVIGCQVQQQFEEGLFKVSIAT